MSSYTARAEARSQELQQIAHNLIVNAPENEGEYERAVRHGLITQFQRDAAWELIRAFPNADETWLKGVLKTIDETWQ